jgi:hypothetical protein
MVVVKFFAYGYPRHLLPSKAVELSSKKRHGTAANL